MAYRCNNRTLCHSAHGDVKRALVISLLSRARHALCYFDRANLPNCVAHWFAAPPAFHPLFALAIELISIARAKYERRSSSGKYRLCESG